jgi:hypothetical protein
VNRVTNRRREIEAVLKRDQMWREPLPSGEKHAPALTERRLIDHTLSLASSRTARAATRHAWALQEMQEVSNKVAPQVARGELFDPDHLMQVRDGLATDLDAIRADRGGKLPARLIEKAERDGSKILLIPRISFDNGTLGVVHRYWPLDLDAAIGYALALLLDAGRPYRAKLCRCDLSTCRRFFLAPPSMPGKGGKPLTTVCNPLHKPLADNEKSLERTRRWREKRKTK